MTRVGRLGILVLILTLIGLMVLGIKISAFNKHKLNNLPSPSPTVLISPVPTLSISPSPVLTQTPVPVPVCCRTTFIPVPQQSHSHSSKPSKSPTSKPSPSKTPTPKPSKLCIPNTRICPIQSTPSRRRGPHRQDHLEFRWITPQIKLYPTNLVILLQNFGSHLSRVVQL